MSKVQIQTLQNPNPVHQIHICRICLIPETEAYSKLLDIHTLPTARFLEEITGCTVGRRDGLPPFVCLLCSHLLHRFNDFRQQCLSSRDLLHDAAENDLIYKNLANNEAQKYYKPLLTTTPVELIDTVTEITQTYNIVPIQPVTNCDQPTLLICPLTISNIFEDKVTQEDIIVKEINLNDIYYDENDYDTVDNENTDHINDENYRNTDTDEHYVKPDDVDFEINVHNSDINDKTAEDHNIKENVVEENVKKAKTKTRLDGLSIIEQQGVTMKERKIILKKKPRTDYDKKLLKRPKLAARGRDYLKFYCNKYNVEWSVLSKEQQIQEIHDRKESSNYLNSPYKCNVCFKGFTVSATFENHVTVRHSPNDPYSCDICGFRYKQNRSCLNHIRSTHRHRLKCKKCGEVVKSFDMAKVHYDWHNGHKYTCQHCGKEFRKRSSKWNHIRKRHASVQCTSCNESFTSQFGLQAHLRMAHKEVLCTSCNVYFSNVSALEKHAPELNHCDLTLRPCVQCGEGFLTQEALRDHILTKHNHEEGYPCEYCDKILSSHAALVSHVQHAHIYKSQDKEVRKKKQISKPLMCEMCGKNSFRCQAALAYHQRCHTGERPYKCTSCSKSFSMPHNLKLHMETHTERRHECTVCKMVFKHTNYLKRHMRRFHTVKSERT